MKKTILLLLIALIFCLKLVSAADYFGFHNIDPFNFNGISGFAIASQSSNNDYTSPRVGMANPAAIYCNGLGYDYKVIDTGNGQDGVCTFPNGSQCEEWKFLEGLCGQNYSYCALNGYGIITKSDGNSTLSYTYSVCVNKTTKKEVGSVINLFGLIGKSVMSAENLTEQNSTVSTESVSSPFVPLPSYFDWRDNGGNWTTGVKDQGLCGACWAFAAVGSVEAEYNIFTNTHTDLNLSEEYLISDCFETGHTHDDDCCGGHSADVHNYFASDGVPDASCMNYKDATCGCNPTCGADSACTYNDNYQCSDALCSIDRCPNYKSRLVKADYSGSITSQDRQEIKEKIFTNGPVSAGMDFSEAVPDANGIYRCHDNGLYSDHDVSLVGWNDSGQYWIVKNSNGIGFPGEPSPIDGYYYAAYGVCAIERTISYNSGFSMVDTGDDVHAFYSQSAPADSYPISCISQSAIWDSESRYGDDSIEEINISNNQCEVVGDDTAPSVFGDEQKRYVGVVSIPQSSIPSSPVTQWSSWEYRNQSGYCDGPDCRTETFSSPTCPSGYSPASCLSETGYQINQGLYGEDDIVGMNITSGKCMVTVFDSVTDPEYYRRTGVVCLPSIKPNTVWGSWSLRNDSSGYHDGDNADVETFYGPACPSGSFPISCLSDSANAESEKYYGEDGIVDIRILGGRCVVVANDETGNYEQKRRVATVCLDTTPPAITILSPVSSLSYHKLNVPLNFNVNKPTSWIGYSLDGKPNITIPGPVNLSNMTGPYYISDGSHTITVYANDTSNNMGSSSANFYYCSGDVNNDKKIDGKDIALIAVIFGSAPGVPKWDASMDINDDGKIDGKDTALDAVRFGKGCP